MSWTDRDELWMTRAMAVARQAACAGEVPVGAVLVHQDTELAIGCNRNVADCDPSAHAEIVALRAGGRLLGSQRLLDCTLYCTLEPCPMCVGAIIHARLMRLVYAAPDPKTGACGSVFDLLESPLHNHTVVVRSRVMASEASVLLQQFFAAQRSSPKVSRPKK